ncbi:hypothetical protein CTZ27_27865 [Streptomyces griseocarneus]|nr:hypothetical protein CTZ27_27865 [Streptomyces griseocarneus]
MNKDIPPLRAYVIDTRTGQVGQVVSSEGTLVRLRARASGPTWDCPADALQTTTLRAYLRARISDANARRRD